MDPRAGLDEVEKRKFFTLPGLELRALGRQARSESLYRLLDDVRAKSRSKLVRGRYKI
jgi:hypothetical protein